jgi:hypothetical protein
MITRCLRLEYLDLGLDHEQRAIRRQLVFECCIGGCDRFQGSKDTIVPCLHTVGYIAVIRERQTLYFSFPLPHQVM